MKKHRLLVFVRRVAQCAGCKRDLTSGWTDGLVTLCDDCKEKYFRC